MIMSKKAWLKLSKRQRFLLLVGLQTAQQNKM